MFGTNDAIGIHGSCVKRIAEDGKCVKNGGGPVNKVGTINI